MKNSMVLDFMVLVLFLLLGMQEKQPYVKLVDVNEFVRKWESRPEDGE